MKTSPKSASRLFSSLNKKLFNNNHTVCYIWQQKYRQIGKKIKSKKNPLFQWKFLFVFCYNISINSFEWIPFINTSSGIWSYFHPSCKYLLYFLVGLLFLYGYFIDLYIFDAFELRQNIFAKILSLLFSLVDEYVKSRSYLV